MPLQSGVELALPRATWVHSLPRLSSISIADSQFLTGSPFIHIFASGDYTTANTIVAARRTHFLRHHKRHAGSTLLLKGFSTTPHARSLSLHHRLLVRMRARLRVGRGGRDGRAACLTARRHAAARHKTMRAGR